MSTGKTRHIFFPFDTKNDTAIKVAMEMVEELEISHLEPLEIAAMIDNEISNLFPTWIGTHGKCEHQLQHSFNYEEEDEDLHNHNPFVVLSSSCPSSPHDSLRSMNSYKSSSFRYHHEDEHVQSIEEEEAEAKHNKLTCIRSCRCGGSKMEEHKSMQLQRWELLEEVYKRRMFNTVATMEGIGFQHPDGGGHHCGR